MKQCVCVSMCNVCMCECLTPLSRLSNAYNKISAALTLVSILCSINEGTFELISVASSASVQLHTKDYSQNVNTFFHPGNFLHLQNHLANMKSTLAAHPIYIHVSDVTGWFFGPIQHSCIGSDEAYRIASHRIASFVMEWNHFVVINYL